MEAVTFLLNFIQTPVKSSDKNKMSDGSVVVRQCSRAEMDSSCNSKVLISQIQSNMPLHLIDV